MFIPFFDHSKTLPSINASASSPASALREWNELFTKPQKLDYETENTPYVELKQRLVDEVFQDVPGAVTEGALVKDQDKATFFSDFMREGDEFDHQADLVESFIGPDVSPETLKKQHEMPSAKLEAVALLNERSSRGGKARFRKFKGPLDAWQLYEALKVPRRRQQSRPERSNSPTASPTSIVLRSSLVKSLSNLWSGIPHRDSAGRISVDEYFEDEPDGDCRFIFVFDPDSWSMCALAGAAYWHQAPVLGAMFAQYLTFEPLISVHLSSPRTLLFQLVCQLPYYALRDSQTPHKDPRCFADQQSLRTFEDVSFLNLGFSTQSSYLYETVIAFRIAGRDEQMWDAWGFEETHADTGLPGRASIYSYADDDDEAREDPFTRRQIIVDAAVENPLEYFVMILRHRIQKVKREIERIRSRVTKCTKLHKQAKGYRSAFRKDDDVLQQEMALFQDDQEIFDWIGRVGGLASQQSVHLSKLIGTWEQFLVTFECLFEAPSRKFWLRNIKEDFDDLGREQAIFQHGAAYCDAVRRDLAISINYGSLGSNIREGVLAQHQSLRTANIMMGFGALATAAQLFSTSKGVNPLPSNTWALVGVTFMLLFVGILMNHYACLPRNAGPKGHGDWLLRPPWRRKRPRAKLEVTD